MLKIYLMLGGFAIVGGVVFGAYKSYNNMQQEIKILTANNAKLETALETSEASNMKVNDYLEPVFLKPTLNSKF